MPAHQHLSYKETLDTLVPYAKQTVFPKDEDTVEEIEDDSDGSSCDSEDDVIVKKKINQEFSKKSKYLSPKLRNLLFANILGK